MLQQESPKLLSNESQIHWRDLDNNSNILKAHPRTKAEATLARVLV